MNRVLTIVIGALIMLAMATLVLVALPYRQLKDESPPEQLKPYTIAQLRGRATYVNMGCVYCHSQQPRPPSIGPDGLRGWGRAPVPSDYVYDYPHLLGVSRTGPDLFNIGARQPSVDWQLTHLYQPRSVSPGSVMPAYPFLFRVVAHPALRRQGRYVAPAIRAEGRRGRGDAGSAGPGGVLDVAQSHLSRDRPTIPERCHEQRQSTA